MQHLKKGNDPTTPEKWDRLLKSLDIYGMQFRLSCFYYKHQVTGQKIIYNDDTKIMILNLMLNQIR